MERGTEYSPNKEGETTFFAVCNSCDFYIESTDTRYIWQEKIEHEAINEDHHMVIGQK